MIDVIWHGRGGQGAFTASRLLGAAYSAEEGKHALAFPSFGPERRGAPMRAFTKLSDAKIGNRTVPVKADVVVYLDETLFDENYAAELKPGGSVLVNSSKAIDAPDVATVDADGISREILGRAIPNTALLAALTQFIDGFTPASLVGAIRSNMPSRLHESNIAIVETVIDQMSKTDNEEGGR